MESIAVPLFRPCTNDLALIVVLSAVDVHTFFGALKFGYLFFTWEPREKASIFPTFVNSSISSSEMGEVQFAKNDRAPALLQSTVEFPSPQMNGSMYSS